MKEAKINNENEAAHMCTEPVYIVSNDVIKTVWLAMSTEKAWSILDYLDHLK